MENTSDQKLLKVLGLRLRLQLDDESFIGDVFYYDADTELLILKESFHDNQEFNLRYINTKEITSINIISSKSLKEILAVTNAIKIDYNAILKGEMKQKEELKKTPPLEDLRVKKIFEKLEKTYPEAEWVGRCIVFPTLKVKVLPPYTSKHIVGELKSAKLIWAQLDKINNSF